MNNLTRCIFSLSFILLSITTVSLTTSCSSSSRESVEENFKANETAFYELSSYFDSLSKPFDSTYLIILRIKTTSPEIVDFSAYPMVGSVGEDNPIIGGANLSINSPKIDSVLKTLGWCRRDLNNLIDLLAKTNCEGITTTEAPGDPIEILLGNSGYGEYSYYVYTHTPLPSTQKPISNSAVGCRTIIKYGAPL